VNIPHLRWGAPGPYEVVFSTRIGGVSRGPFESLNLGWLTEDDPEHVVMNWRVVCTLVGVDHGELAFNRQVHGADVREARTGDRGRPGDGLWSERSGLAMLATTADCLPVALVRVRGERPALALLHAGRLGLLAGVLEAGVAALGGGRLAAAIGPGIGPCCYEVGADIAAAYVDRFGEDVVRGRHLDLWTSAERALREAGVADVERLDLCTSCHPELFFSHRRDGGRTGRQGVIGYVA
jgi:YfiH family protein